MTHPPFDAPRFDTLQRGSLTGALINTFDWSKTSLGPAHNWPIALQTVVRTVLHSPQAMFVYWGNDLVVLYNDASLPIIAEKHPGAIGQRAEECWGGAWATIAPQLRDVMEGGQPSLHENLLVPTRREGRVQDAWFTYSYSALFDDVGQIAGVLCIVTETTSEVLWRRQLEAAKREAELAQEDLHRVFMQTPAPMCVLRGPLHHYVLANPMHMRVVGERRVIGLPVREALPELEGQGFFELLDQVYASGERFIGREVPIKVARQEGGELEEAVLDFVYEPHLDAGGAVCGILVVALDVTEMAKARTSLQHALAERDRLLQLAEEMSRRKDEFLAMLAHELRNPLAPIAAAADLLDRASHDPARVKKSSAVIGRQVRHMTGLVDDLLDVARVTRGQVKLDEVEVDVHQIVLDAIEQVRPLIEARRHELSLHTSPEPAVVRGDAKRLVQVLTNLLTNAAKYTPEHGRIAVQLSVDAAAVNVGVTDSGQGMSPDLLQTCFDLFVQGERTSERAAGGLGLGLALVKTLVELHRGTVRAESQGEGKGSRFVVTLPQLPRTARQVSAKTMGHDTPQAAALLKVLIVDDNEDAADMLAMLVDALGHHPVVEHHPRPALERIKADRPDVCLLDIGLPDMDGYELAKAIRNLDGGGGLTLVAVTGYGQPEDREQALRSGFDEHFPKPLDTSKLTALLANSSLKAV